MNIIELRFQLQFLKKGLPNFFEKISARLQSYVTYRQDWKNGIYATRNKTKLLLTRKKNSGLVCVTLAVRGADLQELWLLILTLRADMSNLLQVGIVLSGIMRKLIVIYLVILDPNEHIALYNPSCNIKDRLSYHIKLACFPSYRALPSWM